MRALGVNVTDDVGVDILSLTIVQAERGFAARRVGGVGLAYNTL